MHQFKQLSYSLMYTVEATINYTKPHKVHFPCHLLIQSPLSIQPASRPLLLTLRQERFIAKRKPWQVPGKRSGIRSSTDNEYQTSGKPLLDLGQICGRKKRASCSAGSHFLALKSWSRVLTSSSDWLVMVSFVPISPCNYFASFFTTEGSDQFYLPSLKSLVEICLNMDAKISGHRKYFFSFFWDKISCFEADFTKAVKRKWQMTRKHKRHMRDWDPLSEYRSDWSLRKATSRDLLPKQVYIHATDRNRGDLILLQRQRFSLNS